jgi:hypothetical protein
MYFASCGDPLRRLAGDAAGLLERLHQLVDARDPVAGLGDELGLLVGEVFAAGGLDDAVDELLPLFDLADVAGEHLVCCPHGGVPPSQVARTGKYGFPLLERLPVYTGPALRFGL